MEVQTSHAALLEKAEATIWKVDERRGCLSENAWDPCSVSIILYTYIFIFQAG